MILQTTLCLAAAAVLINFWLAIRCGQVRTRAKIGMGDGGNDQLYRRMRAHANFIEQTPLTLLLYGWVEASTKAPGWLVYLGAAFLLGRVAHAFGMESDDGFRPGRPIGMVTGMVLQLALVVLAVMIALGKL
ncbi:MAG: MAPEG family protein [Proteobacteria bacterium]|nr:MAPEG family protein [Pseudomonadota bacterium]